VLCAYEALATLQILQNAEKSLQTNVRLSTGSLPYKSRIAHGFKLAFVAEIQTDTEEGPSSGLHCQYNTLIAAFSKHHAPERNGLTVVILCIAITSCPIILCPGSKVEPLTY